MKIHLKMLLAAGGSAAIAVVMAFQTLLPTVPFPNPIPAAGMIVLVSPNGVHINQLDPATPAGFLPGKFCVSPTDFMAIDAKAIYACGPANTWVALPVAPPGTNNARLGLGRQMVARSIEAGVLSR